MNTYRHAVWAAILLAGLALLPCSAGAKEYLSKKEALKLAFKDAEVVEQKVTARKEQLEQIRKLAGIKTLPPEFSYFQGTLKGKTTGFAIIDDVIGKTHPITYLLAVEPDGTVAMVEIMAYRESRGGEVRQKSFLKQFKGKTIKDKLRMREDIKHIAGATLSCRSVTDGVRIQLAYLAVLAPLVDEQAMGEGSPETVLASAAGEPRPFTRAQYLMGTLLEVLVYAPDRPHADRAISRAFAEVARLEAILSTYRPGSDVSRLNRAPAGQAGAMSPEVIDLLAQSREISEATHGAFDVTVGPLIELWRNAAGTDTLPSAEALAAVRDRVGLRHLSVQGETVCRLRDGVEVNFGGIGKGYALDHAAEVLRAEGIEAALLNFGGQVLVTGLPPGRTCWTVEVRDPRDPWNPALHLSALRLVAGSVSTSADYARGLTIAGRPYSHILDPRTGQPVAGMRSATVIAPTAAEADALSTALYVLGPEAGRRLAEARGLAALLAADGVGEFRSTAFRLQELPQVAER
ncbi:MAG: FAD:protein FMN transferase [Armatimonadota bacterium]